MKASRLLAIGLAVLVAAALLWLVGGEAYARYREREVERAWVQSFGTLQQLLKKYPKTATNDTLRRLELLVKPLGLDLTPKALKSHTADVVSSPKSPDTESERAWQAIFLYLNAQLEKPEARIDAPPQEVRDFLTDHAKDFQDLEAELVTSPSPSWQFDPSDLDGRQAVPNLLPLMKLQRALLVGALMESVSEDDGAAGGMLEASWKLNQNLRQVPDVTCQLIGLAVARLQVGVLRKVNVDTSLWRARLAEHDFKRSVFDTELLVLWPDSKRYRRQEEIEWRSETKPFKRVKTLFLRPFQEVVWSQDTEKMRLAYLRIKNSPLSDQEISEIMSSIPIPNLLDAFRRVDRLALDAELTAKILQARQLRLQNSGKWPVAIPGIEATRFRGAKWIYSLSPEERMNLSLSKEPHWESGGLILPCRFTSS